MDSSNISEDVLRLLAAFGSFDSAELVDGAINKMLTGCKAEHIAGYATKWSGGHSSDSLCGISDRRSWCGLSGAAMSEHLQHALQLLVYRLENQLDLLLSSRALARQPCPASREHRH